MQFSVIIPTCNRNDLLDKCLECLASQTINKLLYEVIVTDDSKENVARELIEKKHQWVTWIEGPKKGPAANRNMGAKYAQGDWLVFIDDDCLPDTQILKEYFSIVYRNSDLDVLEGRIEPEGNKKSPIDYAPINMEGGRLWSCNFAIRKVAFEELDGFDEKFKYPHMEDVDIRERIVNNNKKILFARHAKVTHPWRKLSDGKKLGKYQEMYIYYHIKHHKEISLIKLLSAIARTHLVLLKTLVFSKYSFSAIKIMYDHIFTVIVNYGKWKKMYVSKP